MAFHGNEIAKTIKFISETPVRLATPGEWPFPAAIRQMANTAALAQLPMHGTAETDDGNNGTANANGIIGGANRPAMVRFLWERKCRNNGFCIWLCYWLGISTRHFASGYILHDEGEGTWAGED